MKEIIKGFLKQHLTLEQRIMIRECFGHPLRTIFPGIYHERYFPNNRVALDITIKCNLGCINCQSSSRQAPSDEGMSLEQIEKFVNDAIELNYRWEQISLHGGEPTLHPQFFEILEILKQYKDWNTNCIIEITSNNIGHHVKDVLNRLPDWVNIGGSNVIKKGAKIDYWFSSYNVAPIDLIRYRYFTDFSKGCARISNCFGLGLSRYGYYPCTPCANVDRVFGFDIGIKKLSLVNEQMLRKQMSILCKYCGHFKEPNELVNKEKMSKSWKEIYERYRKQKPKMTLY